MRKISEFDAITSSRSNVCFTLKKFRRCGVAGPAQGIPLRTKLKFCHDALKVERPLPPP